MQAVFLFLLSKLSLFVNSINTISVTSDPYIRITSSNTKGPNGTERDGDRLEG